MVGATETYALGKLRSLAVQLPASSEARHNDIENCAKLYGEELDRARGAAALLAMTNDMLMGYEKPAPVVADEQIVSYENPEPLFEMHN